MEDTDPEPAEKALADGASQVDTEAIIEQIWDDLGGATSRSVITETVLEVAPAFQAARVKIYVPIFLRKEVLRRLQGGLAHPQGAGERESAHHDSGETTTSSRDEAVEGRVMQAELKLGPARTG
jgi:hypothetical protein